jgi:ribulose-5-phosphate 4-epimerase/fuculose-1-phosphate aldolase
MLLAEQGIPIFPSSRLITSSEIAAPLVNVMGDKNVCILKGHGIAVAGRSVEEATVRAIKLEFLARVNWEVAKSGRQTSDISREDIDSFVLSRQMHESDRPYAANWIWRYYVKMLQEGRRIPNDIAIGTDGI